MKIVLVSDVHGNAPALQQVIDQEGGTSRYIVLGDIMGLISYPKETLDLVREFVDIVLAGNHDRAIFHYHEGHVVDESLSNFELQYTIEQIKDEDCLYMEELPYIDVVKIDGHRMCLTHAYPWTGQASGYERGNAGVHKKDVIEVASVVEDDYDYVFHGHTHEQYDLDCSKYGHGVHFVNPGTLGYNGEYATFDTSNGCVTLKSVDLDWNKMRDHVESVLPEGCPPVRDWL